MNTNEVTQVDMFGCEWFHICDGVEHNGKTIRFDVAMFSSFSNRRDAIEIELKPGGVIEIRTIEGGVVVRPSVANVIRVRSEDL